MSTLPPCRSRRALVLVPLVLAAAVAGQTIIAPTRADTPARATVDFNRDVRPILSDNCFLCHGPDPGTRKAKLRLDTREGALADSKTGGKIIVPGQASASELVQRVSSAEPTEVMPPPRSGKKLTPQQVDLL